MTCYDVKNSVAAPTPKGRSQQLKLIAAVAAPTPNRSRPCKLIAAAPYVLSASSGASSLVHTGPGAQPHSSWLLKCRKKLAKLSSLRHDWNGYGSDAPSVAAVANACEILDWLHRMGFPPSIISAHADGGISITFSGHFENNPRKRLLAYVTCLNDGDITATTADFRTGWMPPNVLDVDESCIKETLLEIHEFITQ